MKKNIFIAIISLGLAMSLIAGCGKKADKAITESQIAEEEDKSEEEHKGDCLDEETIVSEQSQSTVDEVVNLRPYITAANRYVQEEVTTNVIGYTTMDYISIDEESANLCPQLAQSLNEFNDIRKKAFLDDYPKFCEAANKHAEYVRENIGEDGSFTGGAEYEYCLDDEIITVMRADNVAMSMLVAYSDFWGTGTINKKYEGVTFDSQTGKRISITDVVVDFKAYDEAVAAEISRKYKNAKQVNMDTKTYNGWVLTPEGIMIYFTEDIVTTDKGDEAFVQVNFDEYPKVFNAKYSVASDEYVIPIRGNDAFYMDIENDGSEREEVVFSPVVLEGAEDSYEYPNFEITIDGKKHSNFEEKWFYGYTPYYMHTNEGNYIYAFTEGYEGDQIERISFICGEPVIEASLPCSPFYVEYIDDPNEEFVEKHIAFSNPGMVHDALSFDANVCGTFKSDAGDEEERTWEVCDIDGRYYIEYVGAYDYAAAEIELLDEYPSQVGDSLMYMVRMYPFSGFSFAGEYWGAGQVMYIKANLGDDKKSIELSESNPFFYEPLRLEAVEGINLHETSNNSIANKNVPEIIGAWRSEVTSNSSDYEIYLQFDESGRVDIVRKCESHTPTVYRGIYNLEKEDRLYTGTIVAEAIGMGTRPEAEWVIEFDSSSDNPIIIGDAYEEGNPIVYDASSMIFEKTSPGEHKTEIHIGPWERTDEVEEMWNEYIYSDDGGFMYDFQPEYIDAIIEEAIGMLDGTGYETYGIQDNGRGGEMWIKVLYDVTEYDQVTRGWIRYDMSDMEYYDVFTFYR